MGLDDVVELDYLATEKFENFLFLDLFPFPIMKLLINYLQHGEASEGLHTFVLTI